MAAFTIYESGGDHRTISLPRSLSKALGYLIDAGKSGVTTAEMTPGYRFSDALLKLRHDHGIKVDTLRGVDPRSKLATYVLRTPVVRRHIPTEAAA